MKAAVRALAASGMLVVTFGLLVAIGCGGGSDGSSTTAATQTTEATQAKATATVRGPEPKVELPQGSPPKKLVVENLKVGHGAEARAGDLLTTQFVAVRIDGKPFESSWERGNRPFSFHLGAEESSPGWETGLRGMRVGGRRELIIPPDLISRFGTPPESGPEDTLVYVIDLLEVSRP